MAHLYSFVAFTNYGESMPFTSPCHMRTFSPILATLGQIIGYLPLTDAKQFSHISETIGKALLSHLNNTVKIVHKWSYFKLENCFLNDYFYLKTLWFAWYWEGTSYSHLFIVLTHLQTYAHKLFQICRVVIWIQGVTIRFANSS